MGAYVSIALKTFDISLFPLVQPFQAGTYAAAAASLLDLSGFWAAFFTKVDCFLPTSSFLAVHLVLAMFPHWLLKLK